MKKLEPPRDVDLTIFPDDWKEINPLKEDQTERLISCITHKDVVFGEKGNQQRDRLRPFGALIGAYLARETDKKYWKQTWSSVRLNGVVMKEISKGFAKVRI